MTNDFRQSPGHLIRRCLQLHNTFFAEETAGLGITAPQWAALRALHESPGSEQVKLSELIANHLLTRTGPETPMGKFLRRYWMPIAGRRDACRSFDRPASRLPQSGRTARSRSGCFSRRPWDWMRIRTLLRAGHHFSSPAATQRTIAKCGSSARLPADSSVRYQSEPACI